MKSGAMGQPRVGQPIGILLAVEPLTDKHPLANPPGMVACVVVLQFVMRTGCDGT